jgi:cell division protein FtsL
VFYIYNSLHTTKAIKKKDELSKQLKELHSERISLESEITQSSKQSEIAEKLKETGLKELSDPPIKIVREKKD